MITGHRGGTSNLYLSGDFILKCAEELLSLADIEENGSGPA